MHQLEVPLGARSDSGPEHRVATRRNPIPVQPIHRNRSKPIGHLKSLAGRRRAYHACAEAGLRPELERIHADDYQAERREEVSRCVEARRGSGLGARLRPGRGGGCGRRRARRWDGCPTDRDGGSARLGGGCRAAGDDQRRSQNAQAPATAHGAELEGGHGHGQSTRLGEVSHEPDHRRPALRQYCGSAVSHVGDATRQDSELATARVEVMTVRNFESAVEALSHGQSAAIDLLAASRRGQPRGRKPK